MVRNGISIGIPLTILQACFLKDSGVSITPADVVNNFAVAEAIYGADRLNDEGGVDLFDDRRVPSQVATAISAAYYSWDPRTRALAPLVVALHAGYTDVVKPRLAPAKPFFVAALWTVGIYYAPLLRTPVSVTHDVLSPAALFLSISALSHAVDVVDLDDDERDGILTPAVSMGAQDAGRYATALAVASAGLHALSPSPLAAYDVAVIVATSSIVRDPVAALVALVVLLATHCWHSVSAIVLLGEFLRSTSASHEWAIETTVHVVDVARSLPDPFQGIVITSLFAGLDLGDWIGSRVLEAYEQVVRRMLD